MKIPIECDCGKVGGTVETTNLPHCRAISLTGILKGERKPTPFFDETGKPRAQVYVLTKQEREGLRSLCGKKRDWQNEGRA